MIIAGGIIGGAIPSVVFGSVGWDEGAGATTRTVTGLSFSTASSRRYIYAQIGHRSASAATAVTIGGVSATFIHSSIVNFRCETWAALVPTGTSGNVSVTTSNNYVLLGVATWAVYDIRSMTPTDTATDNDGGTTVTLDVDIPSRGVGLGVGFAVSVSGGVPGAVTWSGMTEGYDSVPPSGTLARLSGASYTAVSAQTPLATSAVFGSGQFISGHSIALR